MDCKEVAGLPKMQEYVDVLLPVTPVVVANGFVKHVKVADLAPFVH
jgi:hypothetical protein